MPPERRRFPRFTPVETAYAALGTAFSRIGRLKDFSRGGLSFEYLGGVPAEDAQTTVEVFLIDNSFHIHSLPCAVVYDMLEAPHTAADAPLEKRRCGVKLVSPSSGHQGQISFFLSSYVRPEPS